MARTGQFGRLPRSAPSLASEIESIARQMTSQEDADIMSAWQKGGTYQGQKVTDEMMLQHWKMRLAGVSKDDPLYDQYNESIQQLTYSIAESKMTAAYSQNKATDAQMIAFYKGQAAKVPKDSEFYRVIQRDIGQYMARATSKASQGVAAAKEAAYVKQFNDIASRKGIVGQNVTDLITRMAQTGGTLLGGGTTGSLIGGLAAGGNIGAFGVNDPAVMLSLLQQLSATHTHGRGHNDAAGTDAFLYTDQNGKPVTVASWITAQKKVDPSFNGVLTASYINSALDRQISSINEQIDLAKKTGHMTQVAQLQQQKAGIAEFARERADGQVQPAIMVALGVKDAILKDPTATPAAKAAAVTAYRATLAKIALDPRIAGDPEYKNRLIAESEGQAGTVSVTDDFTGLSGSAKSSPGIADDNTILQTSQDQIDAVNTGDYVWVQGNYDSNHQFTPQVGGTSIGAALKADAMNMGVNPQTTTLLDPHTGAVQTVVVGGVPVVTDVTDPTSGVTLLPTTKLPISTAYSFSDGQNAFSFSTNNGTWYSSKGNFAGTPTSNSNGTQLTVTLNPPPSSAVDLTQNTGTDSIPGFPGWHVTGATAGNASTPGSPGKLSYDPQVVASAGDIGRPLDGNGQPVVDPTTDFITLQLQHGMSTPANRQDLAKIADSPTWVQNQADAVNQAAGVQWDPKTGWLPGTGNQTLLALANRQVQQIHGASAFTDSHADWFGKGLDDVGFGLLTVPDKTGTSVTPGAPPVGAVYNPVADTQAAAKIAFGQPALNGTAFEAMGKAWRPNSASLVPSNLNASVQGQDIKLGHSLTLPQYTPPPVNTAGVANPLPTPTANPAPPTGSSAPKGPGPVAV